MSKVQMSQEKVSIPMITLGGPQESYMPGYIANQYTPQASYATEQYTPQAYSSEPCAPPSYTVTTYPSDSYVPRVSETEHYRVSGSCCYEGPSPPPYSCQEVPCDQVGPVNMDSVPPVVVAGIFSSKPTSTICPCCRQIITTEVVFRVGSLTYALCACMCMVGCCFGCCFIPFMSKCCKDVDHYCPCCRYHIYRYKRI